jgi:hypothetical protein
MGFLRPVTGATLECNIKDESIQEKAEVGIIIVMEYIQKCQWNRASTGFNSKSETRQRNGTFILIGLGNRYKGEWSGTGRSLWGHNETGIKLTDFVTPDPTKLKKWQSAFLVITKNRNGKKLICSCVHNLFAVVNLPLFSTSKFLV